MVVKCLTNLMNFMHGMHCGHCFISLIGFILLGQMYSKKCVVLKSFNHLTVLKGGPGSSVGIATGYGLDGSGIESRWGRNFSHLSRPALGPTQLPVQRVPVLSRG
jgi:hypothetical protein